MNRETGSSWILFPNQLLDWAVLRKRMGVQGVQGVQRVFLLEDALFYGKRGGKKGDLRLNLLRLAYMDVCHRRWCKLGTDLGIAVERGDYAAFHQKYGDDIPAWKWMEPCDRLMEAKMKQWGFKDPLASPSFLVKRVELQKYITTVLSSSQRIQHGSFYAKVKEWRPDIPILKTLQTVPNLDRENRRGYHGDMPVPPNAFKKPYGTRDEWREAVERVSRAFPNHPKPLIPWDTCIDTYLIYLPVEPQQAREWMRTFFKERFKNYGEYQDVILFKNPLAFHSGLSVYLNNGFLTPEEVLQTLNRYKGGVSMAALEGFVRQIAGWREYTRLYYYWVPEALYRKNVFGGQKRMLPKAWYLGTTGVWPLDATIQWAMNYGYINHIQRLMVVSNYMTLDGFHPDALYRWMFEFSLDSYEWVMVFNCYSMGSWSDGGIAMRKPYISGAGYIQTMSDIRANSTEKDWATVWTNKYRGFMKKQATILRHTQAWRPNVVG